MGWVNGGCTRKREEEGLQDREDMCEREMGEEEDEKAIETDVGEKKERGERKHVWCILCQG